MAPLEPRQRLRHLWQLVTGSRNLVGLRQGFPFFPILKTASASGQPITKFTLAILGGLVWNVSDIHRGRVWSGKSDDGLFPSGHTNLGRKWGKKDIKIFQQQVCGSCGEKKVVFFHLFFHILQKFNLPRSNKEETTL